MSHTRNEDVIVLFSSFKGWKQLLTEVLY